MKKSVEKSGCVKVTAILFLTLGVVLYSVPAAAIAADDSDLSIVQNMETLGADQKLKKAVTVDKEAPILNVKQEKTDDKGKSMMDEMLEKNAKLQEKNSSEESSSNETGAADAGLLTDQTETVDTADSADVEPEGSLDSAVDSEQESGSESQTETQNSENGNNPPAPPPPAESAPEPAEATASDLYLDALTQPAAQEAQNEEALDQVFNEAQGESEVQAEEGGQTGAAEGASDQAENPQTNIAKKAAAISQTIGEFSTLSARPEGDTDSNADQTPESIHASEQQNFIAAMNVMGNDPQFFSQVMGVTPGENAPMMADMQTGFAQMAEKMAEFFAPEQGGTQPGEGVPGAPGMGPNGMPAGPMTGMPLGTMPGPNAGPAGAEGMPGGPMPMGMFSMNQMANVMGSAMMAVAMGAPPDKVMGAVEGTMQAMHAQAEAYFAANFGSNTNNPEGMTGPNAGPMPGGMEGGNFMPGPGGAPFMVGAGFMPGPEGAAFMAGPQFGAGPGPGSDFNFGGMIPGADFREMSRELSQSIAANITQQLIAQQVFQQNLPAEALNTIQALNNNFQAADLTFLQNNPGQTIARAFNAEITTQYKNTSNVSVAFPGDEHVHVTYSNNTAPGPGDIPFTHVDAEVTAIHSSDHSQTALLPAEAAHIPGVS